MSLIRNRKTLNKIMAVVMVLVVLSMIVALFGSSLLTTAQPTQTAVPLTGQSQ